MTFLLQRQRRIYLFTLLIVTAGLFAWWVVWRIAAAQYDRVLDGWVAEGRAEGYDIGWEERRQFGFPAHVVLRLHGLHWVNTSGTAFKASDIDIAAGLWTHSNFIAKFKGGVELAAPIDNTPQKFLLAGASGSAHISLDPDGVWTAAQVTLSQARLGRDPDYIFTASKLDAAALRPDHPPATHNDTGLTVTGEAQDITLPPLMPPIFGTQAKAVRLGLRIMGPMPDFRRRSSVAAWNSDSGIAEFDTLKLDWGELVATAEGTVGFDDDLQPEGAFASLVQNPDKVLQVLIDHQLIAPTQLEMLQSALNSLTKQAAEKGDSGVRLPITVELGGLFLGPVKVYSFPPVDWPPETSPAVP